MALERLLETARGGRGAVLVVHGDAGVGKTTLLEHVVEAATDFRVVRTAGAQGEDELDYAALQQLCSPILELGERLPDPQREALEVAFGLSSGPVPSPFLVGLAVLSLLSEAAAEQPLLCVVDDAQWLDGASARVLAFDARRLLADRIVLVFATRDARAWSSRASRSCGSSRSAAAMRASCSSPSSRRASTSRCSSGSSPRRAGIRSRSWSFLAGSAPAQLAGGFGLPAALPLSAGIEQSFARRLARLPREARLLLLLAAAEPLGNPALLWRSAEQLGIPESAAHVVESEGFLTLDDAVTFRHPLVRSAVYGSAEPNERREAHRALAEATDPDLDPDRRAWHRAQAASAPDEEVAAELERSAGRAQARGGLAAVAAFLERAAALTPDRAHRAQRLLAAAAAERDAGDLDAALELLARIEPETLDELGQARVDLLRARIAFEQQRGGDAGELFLSAARRLERLDPNLARETYLEALGAAMANDVKVIGGAARVAAAAAPPRPAPCLPGRSTSCSMRSRSA